MYSTVVSCHVILLPVRTLPSGQLLNAGRLTGSLTHVLTAQPSQCWLPLRSSSPPGIFLTVKLPEVRIKKGNGTAPAIHQNVICRTVCRTVTLLVQVLVMAQARLLASQSALHDLVPVLPYFNSMRCFVASNPIALRTGISRSGLHWQRQTTDQIVDSASRIQLNVLP
jgi:hypothetical protein